MPSCRPPPEERKGQGAVNASDPLVKQLKAAGTRPKAFHAGKARAPSRSRDALPPLKRRIVSVIMRAGREGITAADLYGIIYGNELPPLPSRKVLKAHAWQLRRLGFPIKGKSGGANEGAYDPRQRAVMRHVGSDVDALSATIGAAARLTVAESGTPRFARLPKDSLSQRNGSLPIAPNEAAGQRTPSVLASPRALCGERGGAP